MSCNPVPNEPHTINCLIVKEREGGAILRFVKFGIKFGASPFVAQPITIAEGCALRPRYATFKARLR